MTGMAEEGVSAINTVVDNRDRGAGYPNVGGRTTSTGMEGQTLGCWRTVLMTRLPGSAPRYAL